MFYRNLFNQSLLILCLVLLTGGAWARDVDGKRSITAVRTETPLKVDGLLNDPAWQKTLFLGQFTQREPEDGAPASEKTELGFLYDEKNLYIGVKCYDSEPDKIIAREMRRDAIVDDD
ncbi:MAG: hypothetical protein OEZ52_14990, partial [Candidatus Aminicenantes bacterium]|nr:hypothetical protein [Candidatus Aminicenantes bacterium]MDH5744847.1 hypothetical protein [Candidatus Aminicenantes bacterium]